MHTQECTSEYNFWRRNLIVLSNSTRIRDTAAFSLTSFHIYVTSTLQNFCWPWNNFHSNSEGKKWPLRAENNHWPFLPVPSGSGDGFFFFIILCFFSPQFLSGCWPFQLLYHIEYLYFRLLSPGIAASAFLWWNLILFPALTLTFPSPKRMISPCLLVKAAPSNLVSSVNLIIFVFTWQDIASTQ